MDNIIKLLSKELSYGYVLAYFTDKMIVGKFEHGAFKFNREYKADKLIKMHIFNEDKEVRYFASKDKVIVINKESDDDQYFDEAMYVLGDDHEAKYHDGFYTYTQYGRVADIPEDVVDDPTKPVQILVRNVFGTDDYTHQVTIDHYRIIKFVQGGEE